MCRPDRVELLKLTLVEAEMSECHTSDSPRNAVYIRSKVKASIQPNLVFCNNHYIEMTFITAVAGPSRRPSIQVAVALVRGAATSAAPPGASEDPALEAPDAKRAQAQLKAFWGSEQGYKSWMGKVGVQYRDVPKGSKARWMGGSFVSRILFTALSISILIHSHISQIPLSALLHLFPTTCKTPFSNIARAGHQH
jgi:hypothetical protein